MAKIRQSYSATFKAKVAFEAVKAEKTISQLSSEYGVHSNQINGASVCWRSFPIYFQKSEKRRKRTPRNSKLNFTGKSVN